MGFLEVYLDLLSQPCRAVHIFLSHNKIPHKLRIVALRKGEHKTPEFTKLNPMQQVPVMVDKGFVLTERSCRPYPVLSLMRTAIRNPVERDEEGGYVGML
uniref:Glutathione S-transferase theta 2 n=1 Tax=Scleropages formosus TaxID=113540 RepID=A0A8C9TSC9_SCLFO